MAKKSRLLLTLIFCCLALPVFLLGCQSPSSKNTPNQSAKTQQSEDLKKEHAIRLAGDLSLAAQIAIAGLGRNPGGLSTLKLNNANCGAWTNQLSSLLRSGKVRQEIVNNDELKIALSALQLIASGQFLMDVPTLVLGVTNNVAAFPLDLYLDVKKLEAVHTEDKAQIHNLRQELLNNINAIKTNRKSCRLSLAKYLKSKAGLIERQCTPKISAPVLDKLRDLAVPKLALNTANDVVKNDSAWTAAQIFAFTHGWTVTEATRAALEKALSDNPDLGPLVDSGIDVLLKKENADNVLGFLGKVKDTNNSCGPKDPIKLNDQSVVTLP
jgi:hypothetical protein